MRGRRLRRERADDFASIACRHSALIGMAMSAGSFSGCGRYYWGWSVTVWVALQRASSNATTAIIAEAGAEGVLSPHRVWSASFGWHCPGSPFVFPSINGTSRMTKVLSNVKPTKGLEAVVLILGRAEA